jgi:hypothetical protein
MDDVSEKKSENMQDLKKEVTRRWYKDGLFEVSVGIVCLFLGLMVLFYRMAPFRPLYTVIWILVYGTIVFVGSIWLPRKLKERLIWDKVGYSITKECYPISFWVFLSLAFLSGVLAVFSVAFLSSEVATLFFGGVWFFGSISQFFQAGRIKIFLYLSFVPLFVAGVCALLGLSWKQSIGVIVFAVGCVSLISGIVVYKKFREEYDG